ARCTCIPELLGGAEASQNGFRERMPAKLILRSATSHQPFMNRSRGQLAVFDGHHRGGGSSRANTVAAGVNTRRTGLEIPVHLDEPFVGLEFQHRSQWRFLLASGLHNLV